MFSLWMLLSPVWAATEGSEPVDSGENRAEETNAVEEANAEDAANAEEAALPLVSLETARRMALDTNHDLVDLRETLLQADIGIQRAWGMLLPSVSLQGIVTRNDKEKTFPSQRQMDSLQQACDGGDQTACIELQATNPMTIRELWSKSASLTGQMALFNPRSIPTIMSAHIRRESMRLTKAHGEAELLYGVTSAYYAVLQARKLVSIAKEALGMAKEHLRLAHVRLEAGTGVNIEVLRAEMGVADAEASLNEARNGFELARQSLGFLIGKPEPFRVRKPAQPPSETPMETPELLAYALAHRKDLKAARQSVEAAEKSEIDSWLSLAPNFFMQGSYDWQDSSGLTSDEESWRILFIANLPLFDAGQRIADIRERRSLLRQARNDLSRKRERAANEVREAALLLKQSGLQLESLKKKRDLAVENYAQAKRRYEVGLADNLTLTDAVTERIHSEQTYANEELALTLAGLALRHRIGRTLVSGERK